MTASAEHKKWRWRGVILLPFAGATIASIAALSQVLFSSGTRTSPIQWLRFVQFSVLQWYFWAAVTPVIIWLSKRVTISGLDRARPFAFHLAAALALSLANTSILVAIELLLVPRVSQIPLATLLRAYITTSVFPDIFIYAGILGACLAIDYRLRLQRQEVEGLHLQSALDKAYIAALQSQLQPHFLFNTLHAIGGLIRKGRNREALNMLVGLGDLLRHVLDHRDVPEVPLAEELVFLDRYLGIQQIRFGDRLRVSVKTSPETHSTLVPSLILQPLVENAIEHGIECRAGPGRVEIRTSRQDQQLVMSVFNEGPPISREWKESAGYGLKNAQWRLERMFGDAHDLAISNVEGGVVATLAVPWKVVDP